MTTSQTCDAPPVKDMDIKLRLVSLLISSACLITACGGGGSGTGAATGPAPAPAPQSATVSVVLTDASTEDYDQALATITQVLLLGEDGPQVIFAGEQTVDLLRLRDSYELFAVSDEVEPGRFEKIRLILKQLVLVREDGDGSIERTNVELPGNGKVDINPRGTFDIAPGEIVAITLDVDMEKSLKFMTTGNGRTKIRPVIFGIIETRPPVAKFTRVAGEIVRLFPGDEAFLLCRRGLVAQPDGEDPFNAPEPERRLCLDVLTDDDTGIFGPDGVPVDYATLMVGDEVIVAGRLAFREDDDDDCGTGEDPEVCPLGSDDDAIACPPGVDACDSDSLYLRRIALNSFVVEQGGPGVFRRWRGVVETGVDPDSSRFDFELDAGQGLAGETLIATQLYEQTRIFTRQGSELDPAALSPGQRAIIDGVLKLSNDEPDELRAALILLEADGVEGEEALAGRILTIDLDNDSLVLSAGSGDRCIDVLPDASIFTVTETDEGLDNERVELGDLEQGQLASLFGADGVDGCFDANLILAIVESESED